MGAEGGQRDGASGITELVALEIQDHRFRPVLGVKGQRELAQPPRKVLIGEPRGNLADPATHPVLPEEATIKKGTAVWSGVASLSI